MSRIFRILAGVIVISAVGIGLSFAETIWEKRQKAIKTETQPRAEQKTEEIAVPDTYDYDEEDMAIPAEQVTLDLTDPFNITVPAAYGSIIDSYKGTNGKLIIQIQSAHANYEAQKNIAGILESLIRDYNVNLILREGGISDRDFSYLRKEVSLQARESTAEEFLKDGRITGIDYVNLTADLPMHIQGIEEKQLYDQNRSALWEMDKFKVIASEYVNKLSTAADSLKTKIYNRDLLALDKAKKDYESENTDLLVYYKALNDIIRKKNIAISEFRNFQNLIKIDELEKKIDFVKINNKTAIDDEKAVYTQYQEALKKLNVNKLFKEEPLLENKIQKAMSENTDQETLYRISKALSIMDKMLKVKLVPEEYKYFLDNMQDFNPQNWANFLKKKSDELGLGLNISENYYVIKDNMPTIERFYATAGERDKIFIEKAQDAMVKDNVRIAALVAGGFHTPALTGLLADAGYSYIVISPRVTTPTDDNLYRKSLEVEWLPEK